MAASAASVWPWRRRSSARPGCGLQPAWLASRYASSAPGEPAAQPVDLGELIVGGARLRLRRRSGEPLAGALRLAEGVRPGAVQAHQLGAADEAVRAEGDEVGVGGAPALERRRPLLGAAEVEERVARADDAAVHGAGDERADLAARHGDHHLVEERHPLARPAHAQQAAALAVARHHHEVGVSEPRADPGGLQEAGVRRGEVAVGRALAPGGAQQPPLFDARFSGLVDQPLRAGEPPGGRRLLARPVHEGEREPVGAACRADGLVALQESRVGPRAGVDARRVVADEVRRGGEAIEIVGVERHLRVQAREPCARIGPRALVEGGSRLVELVGDSHGTILLQTAAAGHTPSSPAPRGPTVPFRGVAALSPSPA